jgi:hypothetical protein
MHIPSPYSNGEDSPLHALKFVVRCNQLRKSKSCQTLPSAKGHDRDAKHQKQKDSDLERFAAEGETVDVTPEEDRLAGRQEVTVEEIDGVVQSREKKEV